MPTLSIVRHANANDLLPLASLLDGLRRVEGIAERRPGVFYRGSKAFLHFHADPAGLFADVRFHDEFERCRVQTAAEQRAFLARVRNSVTEHGTRGVNRRH